jgi:hypothetical protein
MSVFQNNILTATGANALNKDSAFPSLGALDPKQMTSASAVSGTTGIDSKLIHGDRWQEIKGNLTENIEKNLKTDIKENETWEIHENLTFKVDGKTKDTRVEDVKEYFLAESKFEYMLEHTDQHHAKDHQINPTQTFDILHTEGEYKNVDLAIKATALEAKGLSAEVIVAKAEAWGAGAEAFGVQVGAGVLENCVTMLHAEEDELEERLKGMENEIKGLQSQVAAAKVIIMPVRIGICIAIHIDSPFA